MAGGNLLRQQCGQSPLVSPDIILNYGLFELNAGVNAPLGGGTAKIQGKRIELEFNSTPLLATDAKGLPIANTVSNKIVLTRK